MVEFCRTLIRAIYISEHEKNPHVGVDFRRLYMFDNLTSTGILLFFLEVSPCGSPT